MIHELEPEEGSLLSTDAWGLACLLRPQPASSFELLGSFVFFFLRSVSLC